MSDSAPLYNSRITKIYIQYLQKFYPDIDIDSILVEAGITNYGIEDPAHWFTQEQINLFHDKLAQLTDNKFIAREAGRYAASPDAVGIMRPFLLGMVEPSRVFAIVGKAASKFTKSATYKHKKLASNRVEITVKPSDGVQEKQFQCENRIGFFEAIALGFTNKLPNIEHSECIFHGNNSCRYIISWDKSYSLVWKRIRNYAFILPGFSLLALIVASLIFHIHIPFIAISTIIPALLAIILLLSYISISFEKKELSSSLNYLHESTDTLIEQVNINYNNALMTNEIGQAISKQTNSQTILRNIVQIFRKRLDYDRCMILLTDKEKKQILFRAGFGDR